MKITIVGRLISFALITLILIGCNSNSTPKESITIYCAAGMATPIDKIAKQYEEEFGTEVIIQYGGSGALYSSLKVADRGDLYLAADDYYTDMAQREGVAKESTPIAKLTPVVLHKKELTGTIASLESLLDSGKSISFANPDAAAVGKMTKNILSEHNLWDRFEKQIKVFKPTVNDVANDVAIGGTELAIVWDATGELYPKLSYSHISPISDQKFTVSICLLNSTKQPTKALHFMRYISAKDRGLLAFKESGFQTIEGDKWADSPQVLLFSGGVNRLAIDSLVTIFEKREGVTVNRVYNGCGILVGQIKAGERPDMYITCDKSFLAMVDDKFSMIEDISETKIVIVTPLGNPKKIESLNDIVKMPDAKLGVCNPKQSTLGALTEQIFQSEGIADKMHKRVATQTPTADLLVNQIRVGSLDAAIVYYANVASIKDKLEIYNIDHPRASAIQNLGIQNGSDHKFLMDRLITFIATSGGKASYKRNGFSWKLEER